MKGKYVIRKFFAAETKYGISHLIHRNRIFYLHLVRRPSFLDIHFGISDL